MKRLVLESIDQKKEECIQELRLVLQYPYHPDTKFVTLEVNGHGGDFSVSVLPWKSWGKDLFNNAPENDFLFFAHEKLNASEIFSNDDLVDEIDDLTKDYFVPFFRDCFNQAGGKQSKIPYYLWYPNSGESYNLITETWADPEIDDGL